MTRQQTKAAGNLKYASLRNKPRPEGFKLGPAAHKAASAQRREDLFAGCTTRRVGDRLVYFPPDEDGARPFILGNKVDGRLRRREGELRICGECGAEYFWDRAARSNQARCSRRCSGVAAQRTKHAKSVAKGPSKETLDRVFSLLVRSVGCCQSCGATERLQCAHVVSRRYLGVRFAFDNAMCLCAACHMRFTHRPLEWEVFVIDRMGDGAFAELKRRALSHRGPLDRRAVGEVLYSRMRELGLTLKSVPGWSGWTTLHDSEDLP